MTDIVYNKNGVAFDIDALATDVNGKMDRDGLNALASVCVESYQDGTSWYRVYSDGWCEQGGYFTAVANDYPTNVVTFLKPFATSRYFIAHTHDRSGTTLNTTAENFNTVGIRNKKSTDFTFWCSTSQSLNGACWYACGYIR